MSELRFLRVINWLLLTLIVAGLVWAGGWRLSGNKWERVETASMGTVAPVGTLLWVEPVKFGSLKVGDFITFHPPGQPDVTYSHRVHMINSDDTITTKGQITSPDPWRLTSSDIVGKVAMKWKGVGWIVKAAPVLFIGGFALWVIIWRMKDERWKIPVGVVGAALILSLAIVIYRPLIKADQLAFTAVPSGAKATYVSTGLLPVRLQAYKGEHTDLRAGHVGSVTSEVKDKQGRYGVSIHPHIPFWWWVVLSLLCFIPAFWTLAVGLPPEVAPRRRAEPVPKG
jgi:signal peptidase I